MFLFFTAGKVYPKTGIMIRLTRNLDKDRGFVNGAFGEIVETVWCPLTGACEESCYSSLQFQPDWQSEWGPEWNCPGANLDFCTLEGMCNYDNVRPFSPTFEFGGSSLLPHGPKTLAPLEDPDQLVTVQWDYKINMTFEVMNYQSVNKLK